MLSDTIYSRFDVYGLTSKETTGRVHRTADVTRLIHGYNKHWLSQWVNTHPLRTDLSLQQAPADYLVGWVLASRRASSLLLCRGLGVWKQFVTPRTLRSDHWLNEYTGVCRDNYTHMNRMILR